MARERLMVDGEGAVGPDRLTAAAEANASNAAKTIAALQELGVGGGAPVDTRAALTKLTSGQTLTDAEKQALGMSTTPVATSRTGNIGSGDVKDPLRNKSVQPDAPAGYVYKWIGSTANGSWQLYKSGTSTSSTPTPTPTPPAPQGTDPATLALIQSLQNQIANLTNAQNTAAQAAALEKAKAAEQQRQSIITILTDRFAKYGLSSLVGKIKELAIDGATEATITLALQDTAEYQMRFKANQTRLAKGLTVLQPAEYLNLEDGYRQVLRSYGLKQFDTDEYVQQFIANDVSATELSNRVVTAVQRVQNADPAILTQLRQYYGIGDNDLVAYVLDPNQQFQKIERQVAAAEIGVAAARQGLTAGVSVSEQLAAQGVTQAEAQKGYATIADILPTAEKLSQIYGATEETYGQGEAEQEVFNQLASAQRKREKLSAREIAAFSGSAGTAKTSLTSPTQGTFQNPDVDLSAPRSVQVREQKPAYPPR